MGGSIGLLSFTLSKKIGSLFCFFSSGYKREILRGWEGGCGLGLEGTFLFLKTQRWMLAGERNGGGGGDP